MSEEVTRTTGSRWKPFLMGAFLGGLLGFADGALLVGLFGWAYSIVVTEEALDPLADLNITKESLSTDETKGYIDGLAEEYLQSENGIGLIVGYIDGDDREVYGYGTMRAGTDNVPDAQTVFEIGSVGKTFTAAVLASMQTSGDIDWGSTIEDFLPEEVNAPQYQGRSITLLDLVTQTSGLPRLPDDFEPTDMLDPYADFKVGDLYEALAQARIESPIGKSYKYSNLGFGLLGHLLALRAETSFEDLVVERICDPLGMDDTRMTLDEAQQSRVASPHDGGKPVPVWSNETLAGAGAFLSTADDMLKYVAAYLQPGDGETLSTALPLCIEKRRPTDEPARAIGLGWHIDSENALDIIWHNGGTGGSSSYVAMLPKSQIGVVVLSNSTESVDEIGHKIVYLLHRH